MTVDTPNNTHCVSSLVFDGLFTYLFSGVDLDRDLYSLTYNGEDGLEHEWTHIGSIPKIDYYHFIGGPFLQLDGMLTTLHKLNDGSFIGRSLWRMKSGKWQKLKFQDKM